MNDPNLNSSIINHLRLLNQKIENANLKKPEDVVRHLAAIQAQDFPGANWSIALRLNGLTESDVLSLVRQRKIVRSWPLRGTLHYTAAEDLRWILSLTSERIIAGMKRRLDDLELDKKAILKCVKILINGLKDGKQFTRDELTKLFRQNKIDAKSNRLSHILYYAGIKKIICFGERKGKQFTYTLLDEWIPPSEEKNRDEALAELARRYFISRSPATVYDFVWWSGLTITAAKEAIEFNKPDLFETKFKNQIYFLYEKNLNSYKKNNAVYLLPGFDEYLISYRDRSAAIEPEFAAKLNHGGGMLNPPIIINGKAAGTWKRVLKGKSVLINAVPFKNFNDKEKNKIILAAEKFGEFLKMPAHVIFTEK